MKKLCEGTIQGVDNRDEYQEEEEEWKADDLGPDLLKQEVLATSTEMKNNKAK